MIRCSCFDLERSQFCFEQFPETPFNYGTPASGADPDWVGLELMDKRTEKVFSVFVKAEEFQRIGLNSRVLERVESSPEAWLILLENAAAIGERLKMAASVASRHLSGSFLRFFHEDRVKANQLMNQLIVDRAAHCKGKENQPGIYLHIGKTSISIFVNLKKTYPLGAGAYGKVRKAIWLTAPGSSTLVAKKVFKRKSSEEGSLHFKRELLALSSFSNQRGVISFISGKAYGDKCVIFLPMYECDLYTWILEKPFEIPLNEQLSMVSQWLEGLAAISKKGIHGDISDNNLLLRRAEEGKMEAVISDFGAFRPLDEGKYGFTTVSVGSPEYFGRTIVTSKLDVWSLGLCVHQMFALKNPPCWGFNEAKMLEWAPSLKPDWILKYPTHPETPPFVWNLIQRMLDPCLHSRISAAEAFDQFSTGWAEYR